MSLERGHIVLVSFPFTDLTSSKLRPAIIISNNPQKEDIVVAFISSVIPKELSKTDLLLKSNHSDFPATGLKKDSVFKLNKLVTIHSSLILRKLGAATISLQKELDQLLKKALGLE